MALSAILALLTQGILQVDYLIAAGGGGGGASIPGSLGEGGSGGAGGLLQGSRVLGPLAYPIVVGARGVTIDGSGARQGGDGGNSTAFGLTALGGGGGGAGGLGAGAGGDGRSGGSGGGGGNSDSVAGAGGAGTGGQGFAGAAGNGAGNGGAGGGAGGVPPSSSARGPGVASSISGSSVTYCVGGVSLLAPSGGAGGGGGGSRGNFGSAGINGVAGVVIIRYLGSQRATGGTITSVGGYTIHTFTSDGTFTVTS